MIAYYTHRNLSAPYAMQLMRKTAARPCRCAARIEAVAQPYARSRHVARASPAQEVLAAREKYVDVDFPSKQADALVANTLILCEAAISNKLAELKGEITIMFSDFKGEIKVMLSEFKSETKASAVELKGDVANKFGEVKDTMKEFVYIVVGVLAVAGLVVAGLVVNPDTIKDSIGFKLLAPVLSWFAARLPK